MWWSKNFVFHNSNCFLSWVWKSYVKNRSGNVIVYHEKFWSSTHTVSVITPCLVIFWSHCILRMCFLFSFLNFPEFRALYMSDKRISFVNSIIQILFNTLHAICRIAYFTNSICACFAYKLFISFNSLLIDLHDNNICN